MNNKQKRDLTYISLFSCAGVGCYGFKKENFKCIATNEYLQKRIDIQKLNNKCELDSGYICGDIQLEETKDKIREEIKKWGLDINGNGKDINKSLDVLIATPPCQGMSIANRKQNDKDINRNSLVVESISLIKEFKPNFFVFENVPAFMNTLCINKKEEVLSINEEIKQQLSDEYIYTSKIINFKNYGSNSSRTRTLIIGVKKVLANELLPIDLFPKYREEKVLKDIIGNFKSLEWGEIDGEDILHSFRTYKEEMREWIHNMPEGMSAFDNEDISKRPHRIENGVIIPHQRKLSGKYTRNSWDKVGPCIHTRNDQMASQNTLHPKDDRVFSIRELMNLMTIPNEFKWFKEEYDYLNNLPLIEKEKILKKQDVNIRQCIGEAVPTSIFIQIAHNIKEFFKKERLKDKEIKNIIGIENLENKEKLIEFINRNYNIYSYSTMLRICELANKNRENNDAFYTNKEILYDIYNYLPNIEKETIQILEPSIGIGCMLPILLNKYENKRINIDLIDIDNNTIEILKVLVEKYYGDIKNVSFNYINSDFLLWENEKNTKYDLGITNPPFKKLSKEERNKYDLYFKNRDLQNCENIVSYFVQKMYEISDYVIIITPKNLLNTNSYKTTRDYLRTKKIDAILDLGENGFKGVLIETICLFISKNKKIKTTVIKSLTKEIEIEQDQKYIMEDKLPYWVIYRNKYFDEMFENMQFGIFDVFRDRQLTNSNTILIDKKEYDKNIDFYKEQNLIRVLKSRNLSDNGKEILNINGYDSYIKEKELMLYNIYRYLNKEDIYIVPNMTYNTRMCVLPKRSIVNGSLAILTLKEEFKNLKLKQKDLEFYCTKDFREFYSIARNYQTRSLNVDVLSVFWYGKVKE